MSSANCEVATETSVNGSGLRRANEVVGRGGRRPEPLFGGFWREGETVLLFGPAGVGKSLLAVQVADALAKGRPIAGFEMPRRRRKVLYVDLILTDAQFRTRYSRDTSVKSGVAHHNFSQNLYRDRPLETENLSQWIAKMCDEHGLSVVIVDDLSAVTRSDNGTRETLRLMRELRRLAPLLGLSILVLADSLDAPSTRDLSEADLRRSRILCEVADRVLLFEPYTIDKRQLSQTRSHDGETGFSKVECRLRSFDAGFVGFEFEKPKGQLDPEMRERVIKVHELREKGMSLRRIAAALGVHKNTVTRDLARWTPDLAKPTEKNELPSPYKYTYTKEDRDATRGGLDIEGVDDPNEYDDEYDPAEDEWANDDTDYGPLIDIDGEGTLGYARQSNDESSDERSTNGGSSYDDARSPERESSHSDIGPLHGPRSITALGSTHDTHGNRSTSTAGTKPRPAPSSGTPSTTNTAPSATNAPAPEFAR